MTSGNGIATTNGSGGLSAKVERVLVQGDLGQLTPEERVSYYNSVCESVGLNPLTRPFDYVRLNGKEQLYAKRDATDQLRAIHRVSITIARREVLDGVLVVTAMATTPDGRMDESIGAVAIANLKGEAAANAYMKAETKAKRRVTLSICGLGWLDETELETIPAAQKADKPKTVAELKAALTPAASFDAEARAIAEATPPPTREFVVTSSESKFAQDVAQAMNEAASAPPVVDPQPPSKAEADLFVMVDEIENVHHARHWRKAHADEVMALPEDARARVVAHLYKRFPSIKPKAHE